MFSWATKVYPWCRCSTRPRDSQASYSIPGLIWKSAVFTVLGQKIRGSSKLSTPTSDPMVQGESLPRSIWLFRQAHSYSVSRHGIAYQCTSTLVSASKLGCPLDLIILTFSPWSPYSKSTRHFCCLSLCQISLSCSFFHHVSVSAGFVFSW